MRLFIQHGLPTLSKCFTGYSERIRKLLRCLQDTTRYLHRLCCHSKVIRLFNLNSIFSFVNFSSFYQYIQNSAIVAQIPFVRETLETLLVRVKELMVTNNCASTDVWNIGNLKNKDLHGHVIVEVCI